MDRRGGKASGNKLRTRFRPEEREKEVNAYATICGNVTRNEAVDGLPVGRARGFVQSHRRLALAKAKTRVENR